MEFRQDETEQADLFFPRSYRDLLDEDSDVKAFIKLFDHFDLAGFKSAYTGEGNVPIDPKLMLRTIFYALQDGVVSVRRLSMLCKVDIRYIVLSGNQRPDRRTWDRFFVRHQAALEAFFKQVVEKAMELDILSLHNVAVDGTRLKGHTKIQAMRYDKMQRAQSHISENLARLRQDIENEDDEDKRKQKEDEINTEEQRLAKIKRAQEQIEKESQNYTVASAKRKPIEERKKSLNDPEALEMSHKSASQGYMFGYNCQIGVDEKSQIIVAAGVHDNVTDYGALKDILEQTKDNVGKVPDNVLCDAGYNCNNNVYATMKEGAQAVFALEQTKDCNPSEPSPMRPFEQVRYRRGYECLAGHAMLIHTRKTSHCELNRPKECSGCLMKNVCAVYDSKAKRISAPLPENLEYMKKHAAFSRTPEYQDTYRLRKKIVEPVFGNMKSNKNFTLYVKGKAQVATRFICVCIAHNLEKIQAVMTGLLQKLTIKLTSTFLNDARLAFCRNPLLLEIN